MLGHELPIHVLTDLDLLSRADEESPIAAAPHKGEGYDKHSANLRCA